MLSFGLTNNFNVKCLDIMHILEPDGKYDKLNGCYIFNMVMNVCARTLEYIY